MCTLKACRIDQPYHINTRKREHMAASILFYCMEAATSKVQQSSGKIPDKIRQDLRKSEHLENARKRPKTSKKRPNCENGQKRKKLRKCFRHPPCNPVVPQPPRPPPPPFVRSFVRLFVRRSKATY